MDPQNSGIFMERYGTIKKLSVVPWFFPRSVGRFRTGTIGDYGQILLLVGWGMKQFLYIARGARPCTDVVHPETVVVTDRCSFQTNRPLGKLTWL